MVSLGQLVLGSYDVVYIDKLIDIRIRKKMKWFGMEYYIHVFFVLLNDIVYMFLYV